MKTCFDIGEAADFAGLSVASIKHHVYKTGLLQGEVIHGGKVLVFSLDELLAFQHNRKIIHTGFVAGRRPVRVAPRLPSVIEEHDYLVSMRDREEGAE